MINSLISDIIIDIISGTTASFIVSPIITVLDRAIIENANGKQLLKKSIKELTLNMIKNPVSFIFRKEFLLIHGLYSSTYISANIIDSICDYKDIDNKLPKIIGTSSVNVTLCVLKDREFAKMFNNLPKHSFPLTSLGLFAMRDILSIGASFIGPTYISNIVEKDFFKYNTSQFICPLLIQFISSPLHLLGLNLYNNKNANFNQRLKFISNEYLKTTIARIARIIPAFSFGCIINTTSKNELKKIKKLNIKIPDFITI
jgi:hypothetical protein